MLLFFILNLFSRFDAFLVVSATFEAAIHCKTSCRVKCGQSGCYNTRSSLYLRMCVHYSHLLRVWLFSSLMRIVLNSNMHIPPHWPSSTHPCRRLNLTKSVLFCLFAVIAIPTIIDHYLIYSLVLPAVMLSAVVRIEPCVYGICNTLSPVNQETE